MITKDEIAEALNIDEDLITDSMFTWALNNFYLITGYSSEETAHTLNKLLFTDTNLLHVPHKDITVTSIFLNGTDTDFTLNSNLFVNPDTGGVLFNNGFSGKVELNYTSAAYTHTPLCDYLVSLITYKSLLTFNPEASTNVKRLKLGDYEKELFSSFSSKEGPLEVVQREIDSTLSLLLSNGETTVFGVVG